MIKKLFILPILGLVSFGAFASADDYVISDTPIPTNIIVDGHNVPIVLDTTQNSLICVATSSVDWSKVSTTDRNNCVDTVDGTYVPKSTTILTDNYYDFGRVYYYVPFTVSNSITLTNFRNVAISVSSGRFESLSCTSKSCVFDKGTTYYFNLRGESKYVASSNPRFVNSIVDNPENPDDGGYVPGIPDSFTSGLTNLLTNFGSTIVNWLPTIILVALGIYAIFALFRVVRNYARSSFNG